MSKNENNALAGMTGQDVKEFLDKVENIQDALIIKGMEFLNGTKREKSFDTSHKYWRDDWHFSYASSDDKAYCIVYEETWKGETDYTDYYIPYRAIDDMDGAVASYFEEKARREERVRQRKLAEEQAMAQKKEQEEYEEYLRLKKKFKSQPQ